MEKAWQLVPLFVTGFLVSRMVAHTGLAERALHIFIRNSTGRFGSLVLGLLMVAIFLSLFIPNMLTVIALLPIFEKLSEHLRSLGPETSQLVTPLILALIYGANIGGMGSLIGSPANALMLLSLEWFHVPGREHINFLSWLTWGIPLVLFFGLIAWGLIMFFLVPKKLRSKVIFETSETTGESGFLIAHPWTLRQTIAARLSIGSIFFWLLLSFLASLFPHLTVLWDGLAVVFGLAFTLLVLGWSPSGPQEEKRPLLRISECYTGLPWRGVYFAAAAVGISLILLKMGAPKWMATQIKQAMPAQMSFFGFALILVLTTTFTTELISNTAASTALFPIAYQLSLQMGWAPLPAMMGVALASTCAFMSPLATPATGLAFGGLKGGSLRSMLALGALTNILGGLWLTFLLTTILPWFYGLQLALPN